MTIRTIAVFHCTASVVSAWSLSDGVVTTLARMGYDVIDCGNPTMTAFPIEELARADLILLSSLEWYGAALIARYGEAWHGLRMPKVAWFVESADRDDQSFDFGGFGWLADRHYYPAIQDAERFGGEWLPFAPDTSIFYPRPVEKIYDAAFLGSLYAKRIDYLQRITHPINYIRSVSDDDQMRSAGLLADAYCSTRIFVNFPAYSRLLVGKVTEVMACGVMLITPAIDHPSGTRNMGQFQDGVHLVYYDPARPQDLGAVVDYYATHAEARETIIRAASREIAQHHTLEARLRKLIADALFDRALVPAPPAAERFSLLTYHNTMLYFDPASNRLCHSPVGWVENNLVLDVAGEHGRLRVKGDAGAALPDCVIERHAGGTVSLRLDGYYLSAEPGGATRADIPHCREWEWFRIVAA